TLHYGENAPLPAGTVLTINFIINGQEFVALNGGPHFTFSPAVSFVIHCDNQQQIDYYWDKLVAGGAPQQCGWLTDRFGVTWQIVPTPFLDMLSSGNKAGAQRATDAMMQMIKLDLPTLQRAFNNQ
ncbi:MAG TPA: VOC family protein, partial [Pseudomonadales bacterium]|nr:VOC family protein [Pseudomonadales bacterium]